MAVSTAGETKSLKFKVQTGTSDAGNSIYATRTLGSVKVDATNENLFNCADKLSVLQKFPVASINISESYGLVQE